MDGTSSVLPTPEETEGRSLLSSEETESESVMLTEKVVLYHTIPCGGWSCPMDGTSSFLPTPEELSSEETESGSVM